MKNILLLLLTIIYFPSLNSKRNNYYAYEHASNEIQRVDTNSQEINIEILNDKTIQFLEQGKNSNISSIKDSLFNRAIYYASEILKIDSTFIPAYINMSVAYTALKKYKEAIKVLSTLRKHIPIFPEATFRMGIISEKMGNDSVAKDYYLKAFIEYKNYLNSPYATAADEINFEFLYLLLEGKDNAVKRIQKKLESSPDNPTYSYLLKTFKEFNRDDYIKNYF